MKQFSSLNFCFWLQGYLASVEVSGATIDREHTQVISTALNLAIDASFKSSQVIVGSPITGSGTTTLYNSNATQPGQYDTSAT